MRTPRFLRRLIPYRCFVCQRLIWRRRYCWDVWLGGDRSNPEHAHQQCLVPPAFTPGVYQGD